ncbi:hypothetical protein IE53DRAFT_336922, partial [Violaceomyces palustris]
MDVEAQDDGVLAKIIVGDGSKAVPVNSIIAIVGEEGDDLSGADALAASAASEQPSSPAAAEEAPKEEPKPETKQPAAAAAESSQPASEAPVRKEGDRIRASPVARRIASEKGIALEKVKGTGPEGLIIKADVENYKAPAVSAPAPAPSAAASAPAPPAPAAAGSSADFTDVPVTGMRRTIAQRLTESKSSIPHYYVSIDVEMD